MTTYEKVLEKFMERGYLLTGDQINILKESIERGDDYAEILETCMENSILLDTNQMDILK